MIRLFKLAIYAVLGYVLFEFFQGMSSGASSSGDGGQQQRRGGMRRDLKNALNQDTGRTRMTGRGRGTETTVEDESGASRTERVGRGAAAK